ncbi:YdcF family protein [Yoonia sp. SDW83-1]|uniref:YdcF family protein n=1 Tax=Yoonia sp. SDW83-1 TaxID=3366945 RepID=UPI00398C2AC3
MVVIGAGMSANGTLHRESLARVDKGVALFAANLAPRIHFSGGRAAPDGPSAGAQMVRHAMAQGIPAAAISIEERSLSTLQNALFSKPMLADAQSILLVTEAFHLPRAKASFWWMGYDNILTAHAGRFRRAPDNTISLTMIGRETLAIWFNLGRAILWSATDRRHDDVLQ